MTLRQRRLGRTGLVVSEIGFGCGPTAGLMLSTSEPDRLRVVGQALEHGMNYFDTAPGYGDGASEAHLGAALQQLGPLASGAIVATKVSLTAADLGRIAETVEWSIAQSVARLGHVDVIQLHNRVVDDVAEPGLPLGPRLVLTVDQVLGAGGVLEGFERAKRRGLAHWLGCSAYGGSMQAVRRLLESDVFDLLSVSYSAANPTAFGPTSGGPPVRHYEGLGAVAAEAGLGVVALRVLEGGALGAPHGSAAVAGASPEERVALSSRAAAVYKQARQEGLEPAAAALGYGLANPRISTVLVGISNLDQLAAAVAASTCPLSAAVAERLAAAPSAAPPQQTHDHSRTDPVLGGR